MLQTREGSTRQLIQFCLGYFVCYVVTGLTVKYFLGSSAKGLPGMLGPEFLVYSTLGGVAVCLSVVLIFRWYRLKSTARRVNILGLKVPVEILYIIPSGVCTAIVIPTTTLMYTLPISVMVAMVMMRGAVIVVSRIIDTIQGLQGILKKKVYWEENVAVVFALAAVFANVLKQTGGGFDFLKSKAAMVVFISYIIAYSIRIYIMNYYRNTAGKKVKRDNKAFFAIEQIAASSTLALAVIFLLLCPGLIDAVGEKFRAVDEDITAVARERIAEETGATLKQRDLPEKDGRLLCYKDNTPLLPVPETDGTGMTGYACPRDESVYIVREIKGENGETTVGFFGPVKLLKYPYNFIREFNRGIQDPLPLWHLATIAGMSFGAGAFFSVFIFIFKGRTATFSALVNRLTSLVAGITATLLAVWLIGYRFPEWQQWLSLGFISVAVGFLTSAERKRVRELAAERENQETAEKPTG